MIRSRKHLVAPTLLVAALAAATPGVAMAQERPSGEDRRDERPRRDRDHDRQGRGRPAGEAATSETVIVTGQKGYGAEKLSSAKQTQALVNTPQTITVITEELIADQGAVNLVEALRNTPGITLQLGENGNTAAGDTISMRGFSAQSAIFQDGIRDLGAVTRDVFNIGQVEVVKGAAGSDIGRGASSGYINQVSKTARLQDARSAYLAGTSEGGVRATADINEGVGESFGVRLNLMVQDLPTPGRDEVEATGYGVAPAVAFGLGTPTEFHLFAQHIRHDNVPDGGIPSIGIEGFYNANAALRSGARVDPESFYGSTADSEEVEANMITAKVTHDFGEGMRLANTSRFGRTQMDRVLTGVNALAAPSVDPATWTVARNRQRVDQLNEILANQTILTGSFKTGAVTHDISAGIEALLEGQETLTFSTTGLTIPVANLYNPDSNADLPVPYPTGARVDGSSTTLAAFAFDTLKLKDKWFLTGGVRIENYDTETNSIVASTAATHPTLPVGTLVPAFLQDSGTLTSWKLGALYKPTPNGSVYVSFADSYTPPGSANFSLSSTASNIANPGFDPQQTTNLEAGAKWQFFSRKLTLTGAWYETANKDELAVLDTNTNTYEQLGERTVSGFEFSAAGAITNKWNVIAGLQTMDTEITQGTTGNNTAGASARWSPELSATVWTSYDLTDAITFGAGARYTGEQKRVVDPAAALTTQNVPVLPESWVADAMARYDINDALGLQLNVYNLFDEDYLATLNNSGARLVLGAPRTAYLSLNVAF